MPRHDNPRQIQRVVFGQRAQVIDACGHILEGSGPAAAVADAPVSPENAVPVAADAAAPAAPEMAVREGEPPVATTEETASIGKPLNTEQPDFTKMEMRPGQ